MTNHVRDLLAKTLPDSQPISLTPQQLLSAGRRRRLRRRVGYLSGGTTAVALVAAGGLLLPALPGPDRPPEAADPPPTGPVAGSEQSPTPIEELGNQIRARFAAELPDLQMSPALWRDDPFERIEPFELVNPDDLPDDGASQVADLVGAAYLTTSQGESAGRVEIRLYRPGGWSDQPATTIAGHSWLEDPATNYALVSCWSGSYDVSDDGDPPWTSTGIVATQCDTATADDGSRLITVQGDDYWQGRPRSFYSQSWHTVVAFRPDGTAVKAENFCGNEAADDDPANHCLDLQLTIDQLTSIVLNTPPVPAQ